MYFPASCQSDYLETRDPFRVRTELIRVNVSTAGAFRNADASLLSLLGLFLKSPSGPKRLLLLNKFVARLRDRRSPFKYFSNLTGVHGAGVYV